MNIKLIELKELKDLIEVSNSTIECIILILWVWFKWSFGFDLGLFLDFDYSFFEHFPHLPIQAFASVLWGLALRFSAKPTPTTRCAWPFY